MKHSENGGEKKRILVVDDDAGAVGALRQILIGKGYEVLTAASGEDALPLSTQSPWDLFLLDVALPGMSGFDLCRTLRENAKTRDVPVVFLTAKGRLLDMAEAADAGSDLYLVKPVLASKLLHVIGLFLAADAALARGRRHVQLTEPSA